MTIALESRAVAVLDFWFGPPAESLRLREAWFEKDPAFDAEIARRFTDDYLHAKTGGYDHWQDTALGAVALVLCLDQFPRNMFRDDARAFATDAKALAVAQSALDQGFDEKLAWTQRLFLYMPFEHSEDLGMQELSLSLIGTLPDAEQPESSYSYAKRHWDIIKRFGRFPHRNKVLGRTSTPDEIAFLDQPGSSF